MNDLELMRSYVRNGSEAAFAELAGRYAGLVYSAAMRHLHNAQDAEDITQAVFLLLARKARGLGSGVVLPAWLLRATHYASKTLLRGRVRRQRHEAKAATMNKTTPGGSGGFKDTGPDWDRVAPLLDEAIASLGTSSRDALVLRFFQDNSYREVAKRLSIAEPAARQRVGRGVEQLRSYFARRGVVLSASALEGLVVAHGVAPAPATLVSMAAATPTKGAIAVAKHAALAHGAAMGMIPASAKAAAAAAMVLLIGAISVLILQGHRANQSATLAADAPHVLPLPPVQAGPIHSRVLDPSGKPAAGAEVLLARPSAAVSVYAPAGPGVMAVRAAADGSFEFPSQPDATAIVARNGQGVAQVRVADLQKSDAIRLVPWGRIEGTVKVGESPQVGQTVDLSRTGGSLGEWYAWRVMHEARTRTDGRGRFVFDRVIPLPPGSASQLELKWQAPNAAGQRLVQLSLAPGETVWVELGGTGRPVIGRVAAPAGLPPFTGQLVAQAPTSQPAGVAVWRPTLIPVAVSADGSFRADDVPAGTYNLVLVSVEQVHGMPAAEASAQAYTQLTVGPMPGEPRDQPLDVGTLQASVNQLLASGQQAPDFVATTADGKSLRLSDLRGRFVLLYLRQPGLDDGRWVGRSDLQVIRDRFGGRSDFALLDVPLDPSMTPTRGPTSALSWIMGHQSSDQKASIFPTTVPSTALPPVYLSSMTRLFLIGPDGKCVARSLTGRTAFSELADVMPRTATSNPNVRVHIEHHPLSNGPAVQLAGVAGVGQNVARSAQVERVDGNPGYLNGSLRVLNDGVLAESDDQPGANFFFSYGSLEGRFRMDLPGATDIARINTYSRHRSTRGPQVYAVYGSDGRSAGFNVRPPIGVDPASCGWTKIADVDTRPSGGPSGGQYAVSLTGAAGPIGRFRHLLFLTFATETDDNWGQTFYSEIEVW